MHRGTKGDQGVGRAYREGAARYDSVVQRFNLLGVFGFDIPAWRKMAVEALSLERGDTVVEIGCGTGLNFPLLQEAIGPEGKIIGVDLSGEMLDQARERVAENEWQNVDLVLADAAEFEFPPGVGGVLATFALVLVPACGQVVENGCQSLAPGKRMVVLDILWPASWPHWWRRMMLFPRSLGITDEVIERQPWRTVWKAMERGLVDVSRTNFWMGCLYLAAGTRAAGQDRNACALAV